jgi:hypothetical protein
LRPDRAGPEGPALAAHCQARAEALLAEALRLTPEADRAAFWRDVVCGDPALTLLRRGAVYASLDLQYGSSNGL